MMFNLIALPSPSTDEIYGCGVFCCYARLCYSATVRVTWTRLGLSTLWGNPFLIEVLPLCLINCHDLYNLHDFINLSRSVKSVLPRLVLPCMIHCQFAQLCQVNLFVCQFPGLVKFVRWTLSHHVLHCIAHLSTAMSQSYRVIRICFVLPDHGHIAELPCVWGFTLHCLPTTAHRWCLREVSYLPRPIGTFMRLGTISLHHLLELAHKIWRIKSKIRTIEG